MQHGCPVIGTRTTLVSGYYWGLTPGAWPLGAQVLLGPAAAGP